MTDLDNCPHCGGSLKQKATRKSYCGACGKMSCEQEVLPGHTLFDPKVRYTCTQADCRAEFDKPACFGRFMEPGQTWTESQGDCSQYCQHRVACHFATSGDTSKDSP
jgi:hypothetical protein